MSISTEGSDMPTMRLKSGAGGKRMNEAILNFEEGSKGKEQMNFDCAF